MREFRRITGGGRASIADQLRAQLLRSLIRSPPRVRPEGRPGLVMPLITLNSSGRKLPEPADAIIRGRRDPVSVLNAPGRKRCWRCVSSAAPSLSSSTRQQRFMPRRRRRHVTVENGSRKVSGSNCRWRVSRVTEVNRPAGRCSASVSTWRRPGQGTGRRCVTCTLGQDTVG